MLFSSNSDCFWLAFMNKWILVLFNAMDWRGFPIGLICVLVLSFISWKGGACLNQSQLVGPLHKGIMVRLSGDQDDPLTYPTSHPYIWLLWNLFQTSLQLYWAWLWQQKFSWGFTCSSGIFYGGGSDWHCWGCAGHPRIYELLTLLVESYIFSILQLVVHHVGYTNLIHILFNR